MSPTQNDMSSTSVKLHFFARLRRFLHSKAGRKSCRSTISGHLDTSLKTGDDDHSTSSDKVGVVEVLVGGTKGCGGGDEEEAVVLQRSVKRLLFGSLEEKEMAAEEIARLARDDAKVRKLMAELGVVPALVAMVGTAVDGRRRAAAVKALVELANGSFTNKAVMVEAGILSKLPNNIVNVDQDTIHGFAELLLSLSSLAKTQFPVSCPETVPFLIGALESTSTSPATKECCLACLTNLATVLENAGPLVASGAVETLLKNLSETALAALGHLAVTLTGKKVMEGSELVPGSLIEALTWEDKPKCQELSAYVLMILAHQSSAQRAKMARSGIVPVLLEVSLMGTPLTQKRALKLLQWFKDERNTRMGPHSGPQARPDIVSGLPQSERGKAQAHVAAKKMMRSLVQQSLEKNMEMITRRANANANANVGDCDCDCDCESSTSSPSNLKALVISTSSKSLPY